MSAAAITLTLGVAGVAAGAATTMGKVVLEEQVGDSVTHHQTLPVDATRVSMLTGPTTCCT